MSTGRFAEYGRPRRVDGGLRARSTRGAIGESWWARRFLDVLESFALGTRLTRGRAYARAGQVLDLTVAPGAVTATVQGSRARPYRVRIGLAAFPGRLWDQVEATLAAQALFSARLLAGDLPAELEQVFAGLGAPLFPGGVGELDQRCDCPDFAVPCKHLAATFYLLAEAFDADPFQLLHWRGRGRDELLHGLRARRAGPPAGRTGPTRTVPPDRPGTTVARESGPERAPAVGAAAALTGLSELALAGTVDRYWLSPVPLPDRRPPTLATEPELLLRQLGPPGSAIGGPGLAQQLRRAYREFGADGEAPDGP
ncbi:SWIM zinc finger family protein [Micromonospora sp. CPCC 206060]|uniref:SWIM zinc finger family protein n=1 Tax=Micromonospora sp. CPCC 206060 TaxID=3122406 RepID=UPI002FEF5F5B